MNKVVFIGRLTRDVELRCSANGQSQVARFSIAVPRKFKRDGDPDADFFNCTLFGKAAESVAKFFSKGKMIAVTGRVENDNYTDKNGNKVYGTRILVEEWDFCEGKNENAMNTAKTQNTPNGEAREGYLTVPEGEMDELPFN